MKPKEFLKKLDEEALVAAIATAELQTTGEIRVFVSGRRLGRDNVTKRAAARFSQLGMTATRERNGVLLYFAPRDRKFALIGDRGIHERCGSMFWEAVAAGLAEKLRSGNFTEAVVEAIQRTGEKLARHFPSSGQNRDELPNHVERD